MSFEDSLYEPALETSIRTIRSSRISSTAYRLSAFSRQLFSFCAAIIIYPLRQLRVKMGMYLYVDDFLITFGQETTKQQLKQVFHELQRF